MTPAPDDFSTLPHRHRHKPKKKGMAWQGWVVFSALVGSGLFCGFSLGRATAPAKGNPVEGITTQDAPYSLKTPNGQFVIVSRSQYDEAMQAVDDAATYRVALASAFRSQTIHVTATAYNASKAQCGNSKGLTATGTKVQQGRTIAVSRRLFKRLKGKRVALFDGNVALGVYTVEDKMHGKMRGNRIDVYLDKLTHAEEFGVKKLRLVVLEA